MQDSGWRFDKRNLMTIYFYKTTELNGLSLKNLLRFSATLKIENDDNFCFLRSILAHLHCFSNVKIGHPLGVSKYRQKFNDLINIGLDFTKGAKYSDFHRLGNLKKFSINILELRFYRDQNEWKPKLVHIEVSEKTQFKWNFWLIEKTTIIWCAH